MKLTVVDVGALVHDAGLPPRVGTRIEGALIQPTVFQQLKSTSEPLIVMDVLKLEMVTSSFADEVIAKTLQNVCNGEFGDRFLVVVASSMEAIEDLARGLKERQLSVLVFQGSLAGPWWIQGIDKSYFRKTLEVIMKHGTLETGAVTRLLALNPQACSNRLAELAKRRLIHRVRDYGAKGGQTHTNMSLLEAAK
jgi:hypothetical protein